VGDIMRILIVEDEYSLADVIASRLKSNNYMVDICVDGEEGEYYACSGNYDLIILDVMLPKKNGFDILKSIRNSNVNSKVIMLTAKSMLEDKLKGFEYGALDYVTKPFHIEELIARVNANLRVNNVNRDIIKYEDLELNIKNYNLYCSSTMINIALVCKEFLILEYFMNNANQLLTKEQIYDKVWGIDNDSISNNLEVYISFIRKKLKAIGTRVNIKSSRNLGYRLEVRDEETFF
jgi:DNA-binding response OmpR family regulator